VRVKPETALPPEIGKEKAINFIKSKTQNTADKSRKKSLISIETAEKILGEFPVSVFM